MAKRYTDTDKWKKPFIRTLQGPYKLLWIYILDECDHAGVWQVDLEVAQVKLGEKLKLEVALSNFKGKIIQISDGQKWFIPDFIEFQYSLLNPTNKVHASVINILSRYDILDDNYKIKGLASIFQDAKDKDKAKAMDKEKEKEAKKIKLKDHLFSESEFYDFEKFESQFENTDYRHCDLRIYFEKAKNWSASKGAKRIDWIATVRNFMISDKEEGKLALRNGTKQTSQKEQSTGNAVSEFTKDRYAS